MGKEITVWPILSGASLLASLHLQCFLFCSEDKHGVLVWGLLCADVFHTEGGLARSWTKGRILNYHVLCKVPLWIACVWFSSPTGITLSKGKSSRRLESENDPTVCVWAEFLPLAHARACYHWCEWETKVLTVSFSQWESFPWCPSLSLSEVFCQPDVAAEMFCWKSWQFVMLGAIIAWEGESFLSVTFCYLSKCQLTDSFIHLTLSCSPQ